MCIPMCTTGSAEGGRRRAHGGRGRRRAHGDAACNRRPGRRYIKRQPRRAPKTCGAIASAVCVLRCSTRLVSQLRCAPRAPCVSEARRGARGAMAPLTRSQLPSDEACSARHTDPAPLRPPRPPQPQPPGSAYGGLTARAFPRPPAPAVAERGGHDEDERASYLHVPPHLRRGDWRQAAACPPPPGRAHRPRLGNDRVHARGGSL